MVEVIVDYKESDYFPKQYALLKDATRFILLVASRRWGKDYILSKKAIGNILHDIASGKGDVAISSWEDDIPRLHYWAIGLTYKHADIIKRYVTRWLLQAGLRKGRDYVYNKSDRKLWLIHWDVLIEFKSAENPDTLVGEGLAGILGTEVARWKPTVWMENVIPAIADKDGWWLLNTSPKGKNWVYHEIYLTSIAYDSLQPIDVRKCDPARAVKTYTGTYLDNTKVKGFIDRVNALKKIMPVDEFERNFMGSFLAYEGQVLVGFSSDNVLDELPKDLKFRYVLGGYDRGYTHRCGIVVVGVTHDLRFYVMTAIGKAKLMFTAQSGELTVTDIIKEQNKKHNPDAWYCSHEVPDQVRTLRDMGINALSWMSAGSKYAASVDGQRSTGEGSGRSRTERYQFLNRLFASKRLFILRDQTELIDDIQSVCYKATIEGDYNQDIVVDQKDDVSDGLGYAIYSYVPLRREVNQLLSFRVAADDAPDGEDK